MARIPKMLLAKQKIADDLHSSPQWAFNATALSQFLTEKAEKWNLPTSYAESKVIRSIMEFGFLRQIKISFEGGPNKMLYIHDEPDVMQIAAALFTRGFFTHQTAMDVYREKEAANTVYITVSENRRPLGLKENLDQAAVDLAFSRPQRKSSKIARFENYRIIGLTSPAEVGSHIYYPPGWAITDLERTLLDCTVRPAYAGGTENILDFYRKALQNRDFQAAEFIKLWEQSEYIYPYQRSIGFYLEQAGYTGELLDKLHGHLSEIDFYLDYQMADPIYCERWRIWVPNHFTVVA